MALLDEVSAPQPAAHAAVGTPAAAPAATPAGPHSEAGDDQALRVGQLGAVVAQFSAQATTPALPTGPGNGTGEDLVLRVGQLEAAVDQLAAQVPLVQAALRDLQPLRPAVTLRTPAGDEEGDLWPS